MIPIRSRRMFLRTLLWAGLGPFVSLPAVAATIHVGSGPDRSFVVLESANLGLRQYEVRYTAADGPYDAKFLIDRILAEDSTIAMTFFNFGTPGEPNFFLDSVTYDSVTETNEVNPPWTPFWAHWVAGGTGFMNPDFTFNPGTAPAGIWSSGFGVSNRRIAPDSWDALFFSDGNTAPSIVPIPEPSSCLLGLAAATLLIRRRR